MKMLKNKKDFYTGYGYIAIKLSLYIWAI